MRYILVVPSAFFLTFVLPSELPAKVLRHLPRKMPPQAYQTSQYAVPRRGIFSASGAALSQEVPTVK
jgi:hypothetical protein